MVPEARQARAGRHLAQHAVPRCRRVRRRLRRLRAHGARAVGVCRRGPRRALGFVQGPEPTDRRGRALSRPALRALHADARARYPVRRSARSAARRAPPGRQRDHRPCVRTARRAPARDPSSRAGGACARRAGRAARALPALAFGDRDPARIRRGRSGHGVSGLDHRLDRQRVGRALARGQRARRRHRTRDRTSVVPDDRGERRGAKPRARRRPGRVARAARLARPLRPRFGVERAGRASCAAARRAARRVRYRRGVARDAARRAVVAARGERDRAQRSRPRDVPAAGRHVRGAGRKARTKPAAARAR